MNLNIQFMRALAALMVLLYHAAPHYFIVVSEDVKNNLNLFSIIDKFGFIGVDIFFVISGYIMWLTTQKLNYGSIKHSIVFLYKRLTRIYLGYWVFFILLIVGYSILGKDTSKVDLVSSFFLTSAAIDKLLIPVSWTLTYELYFYFLFTFLLLFTKNLRKQFFIILFSIILLIQLYVYYQSPEKMYSHLYSFFLSPFILEFILGTFIAYYFETKRIKNIILPLILLMVCFTGGLYYQEYVLGKSMVGGFNVHERVLFFGLTSFFAIAIMVELYYRDILVFPKFSHLLGDSSYSIYLSHTIILLGLYSIGIRNWILTYGKHQLIFILIIVLAILVYSVFHYRYVELPLINLSRKYKKRIEKIF